MARADSRCARCTRAPSTHPWDDVERGESCLEFVQRVVDPLRSKRGRGARKGGIAAQRKANLAAGFHHRTGHGEDGVFYAPDGLPLLIGESKRKRFMPPAEIELALRQAESYAVRERGKPKAALLWTTVPGQGRKGATYLILRAEEWPDVAEQLTDAHESP